MGMSVVERKALGALIGMMDKDGNVKCNLTELAHRMGYKTVGGAVTFALMVLEMKNHIVMTKRTERGAGKYAEIHVLAV